MIDGVDSATVFVGDQERALAWYTGVLGMEKRGDAPFGEGMRWIEVAPPGSPVVLTLVHGCGGWSPERVGRFTGIVPTCDDVDATFSDRSDRGAVCAMPPTRFDRGANAVFTDPDGNGFVLSRR